MWFSFFLLLLGIVILYFGAEWALEAAEKWGQYLGLSELVVGIMLVGLGTSLPEFFVSHLACMRGVPGLALGNVMGSNVANLFLVLGISALVVPLNVYSRSLKNQILLQVILVFVLTGILLTHEINYLTGFILLAFFAYFMLQTYGDMKKDLSTERKEKPPRPSALEGVKLFLGFAMLYAGGEVLVKSCTDLGVQLGLSEYVISAIFVAFGTSFPELVTALLAVRKKKHTDLIVGNILGSNFFNATFVLGSLGVYQIHFQDSFIVEILSLLVGALIIGGLYSKKKPLGAGVALVFLSFYLGNVFNWL